MNDFFLIPNPTPPHIHTINETLACSFFIAFYYSDDLVCGLAQVL